MGGHDNMRTPIARFLLPGGSLALICVAMILSGCARFTGIVDFTASSTSGMRPLSVHFTPAVEGNVRRCIWNFGDGQTSTERSPEHTYMGTGTYTVLLTVIPRHGDPTTVMKVDYITVSSGFGSSPALLTVNDDDFELGGYNEVPSYVDLGGTTVYVLDVLDNDLPGDGAAGLTIIGVSSLAGDYDEDSVDTYAGYAWVRHDGTAILYVVYDEYSYYLDELFYYLATDGQTTAEGSVTIEYFWDDGDHAP